MTKYQKIYQDLLEKIKQGEIKPHTLLPSESELMKIYDASRDTVRKALNLLLNDGYIQKNKGKGSVVLDINRIAFPVSGVTSFKELTKTLHGEVKTIVILFSEEKPDEEIQKALYVKDGLVYHVKRIREIDTCNLEHGIKKNIYVRTNKGKTLYISNKKLNKIIENLKQ